MVTFPHAPTNASEGAPGSRRGQANLEYIVIAVLIAIGVMIGVLGYSRATEDRYTDSIAETENELETDAP